MNHAQTQTQTQTFAPGSPEARALGCTCDPPDGDRYFIHEYCPVHWYILIMARTEDMHNYVRKINSQNTTLIVWLLIAVVITFIYFMSL